MSEQTAAAKANAAAAQGGVLAKLIAFSISLGAIPLASYFASQKYLWPGNDLYSAITAVVAANLVLVAYIFQSIMDEKNAAKPADSKEESKKDR